MFLGEENVKINFNSIAKVLVLSTAAVLILLAPSLGYSQEFVSIQSTNYPGKYIRHSNSLGILDTIKETDALAKKDSSFKMIPGLAGGDTVSFESVNFPGFYLRHSNSRLMISKKTNDRLFKEDASFREVPAINGKGGVSYNSVNYPAYYIRHRNNEIWCEESDGSALFKNDASWFRMEAWTTKK
jgi:hypothetical protein